ncbi:MULTISPECIES: GNAT family N-acetyltransferase [Vibrio]|uniref:GNAT family N-acetyltransferase n=1 Tax=Vibrio TaxID=662 RepID=UPI001FCAF694|nr:MULTISPECIES: N-acetyltransferase [Vibrio]
MMNFRQYHPSEIGTIKQLYTTTFTNSESAEEGNSVGQLSYDLLTTTSPNDFYCFVAESNQTIIGAVIFSKLSAEHANNAYLLSPMAVCTQNQKQGVGQKLINFGLNELKAKGVETAVTYGDPNYYSRVGFEVVEENIIKAPFPLSFPHGWLAQSLTGESIMPILETPKCVEALSKAEYW